MFVCWARVLNQYNILSNHYLYFLYGMNGITSLVNTFISAFHFHVWNTSILQARFVCCPNVKSCRNKNGIQKLLSSTCKNSTTNFQSYNDENPQEIFGSNRISGCFRWTWPHDNVPKKHKRPESFVVPDSMGTTCGVLVVCWKSSVVGEVISNLYAKESNIGEINLFL